LPAQSPRCSSSPQRAAARAYGDPGAGATLAVAAVGYAVLTGLLLPVFAGPVDPLRLLTAPGLLAAGTFGTAAAVSARSA
jgi:hypothetical protein